VRIMKRKWNQGRNEDTPRKRIGVR